MIWTAIFKNYKPILLWSASLIIWGASGYAAYEAFPSKMKAEWKQIERSVTRVNEWNSFQLEELVKGDRHEYVHVQGNIVKSLHSSYFNVKMKVKDTRYFSFEAFLHPDTIYLHNKEEKNWVQLSYTHPTAGELNSMTNPMDFWRVLLTYIKEIERSSEGSQVHYTAILRPFQENAHGIGFKGDDARMEVWLEKETGNLVKIKLQSHMTENSLYKVQKLEYETRFWGVNQAYIPPLPSEALKANKLN